MVIKKNLIIVIEGLSLTNLNRCAPLSFFERLIMSNRVIKYSIWSSPTLAGIGEFAYYLWPRFLLLSDDWGCFNADPEVVKGIIFPKRKEMTAEKVKELLNEYNGAGLLFLWKDETGREWGFFISFNSHHNFCNTSSVDEAGKYTKHRRKTPEPPKQPLKDYFATLSDTFRHFTTNSLIPKPIPKPIPIPKPNTDSATAPDNSEIILKYPCIKDEIYELRQNKINEYIESYPAVNVLFECKKARQWCIDNKTKRKTLKGMPKFINSWLARAQDRGGQFKGKQEGSRQADAGGFDFKGSKPLVKAPEPTVGQK